MEFEDELYNELWEEVTQVATPDEPPEPPPLPPPSEAYRETVETLRHRIEVQAMQIQWLVHQVKALKDRQGCSE